MKKKHIILVGMIFILLAAFASARTETGIVFSGNDIAVSGPGAKAGESTVTITEGGVYVLRGESENMRVSIDAGKKDEVTLILDGVSLSCPDASVIEAGKLALLTIETRAGTENKLVSGTEGAAAQDKTAAVWCTCALRFSGDGALTAEGNLRHGVRTSKDMEILSGTLYVSGAEDALHGGKGVTLSGGRVTLSAAEKALHADDEVWISGGSLCVEDSREGIEGSHVVLLGGQLKVNARDNAINAGGDADAALAQKALEMLPDSNEKSKWKTFFALGYPCIAVRGGDIRACGEKDGLDSNGHILIQGGQMLLCGAESGKHGALDAGYENGGQCLISGGVVLALGQGGFDAASPQAFGFCTLDRRAGESVTVTDAEGNTVFEAVLPRDAQTLLISCEIENWKIE